MSKTPDSTLSSTHPKTAVHRAVRGMTWMSLSVVVSKFASLGSQVILGWLLSVEDFGLYAVAISIGAIFLVLRHGGTEQLLIQKGKKFAAYAPAVLRIALVFNSIACVGLIGFAPMLAEWYGMPGLEMMLYVVAFSFPLNTPVVLFKSRLAIRQEFSVIARINALSAICRHGSMVLFALFGFGPMSFVLPLIVVALFEVFSYGKAAKVSMERLDHPWVVARSMLKDCAWVLAGALAIALAAQGDYLAVGKFVSPDVLGQYFFGYQLLGAVVVLFTNAIQSVLLPTFVGLASEPERQAAGFLKALRVLGTVMAPASVLIAIAVAPFIAFVWQSKWDASILVAQVIAVSTPGWTYGYIGRTFIEARGWWGVRTLLLWGDAIGTIFVALAGVLLGGLVGLAVAVALYRMFYGYAVIVCAAKMANVSVGEVMGAATPPLVLSLVSGVIALTVALVLAGHASLYERSAIMFCLFMLLFVVLSSFMQAGRWREFRKVLNM